MARTQADGLTDRQRAFCAEYLVDLNGSAAAVRAGYSASNAHVKASQLLDDPRIKATIAKLMADRQRRTLITQDRVLRELARIAFLDPREVLEWDAAGVTLKPSTRLRRREAAAVAEISQTAHGVRVKFHSKQSALELIGRHLGMFGPDKKDGGPTAEEIAAAVAAIREAAE